MVVFFGSIPHADLLKSVARRIDGHNQLPKLILGVKFTDGIEVFGASAAPHAAA